MRHIFLVSGNISALVTITNCPQVNLRSMLLDSVAPNRGKHCSRSKKRGDIQVSILFKNES